MAQALAMHEQYAALQASLQASLTASVYATLRDSLAAAAAATVPASELAADGSPALLSMPLVAQAAEPQTYGMVSGFVSSETAPASKEAVLSVDPVPKPSTTSLGTLPPAFRPLEPSSASGYLSSLLGADDLMFPPAVGTKSGATPFELSNISALFASSPTILDSLSMSSSSLCEAKPRISVPKSHKQEQQPSSRMDLQQGQHAISDAAKRHSRKRMRLASISSSNATNERSLGSAHQPATRLYSAADRAGLPDPVLNLKFLYLFLDFSARHPDNELPRHQLAQFGGLSLDKPVPLADIASVPIMRFPSLPGYFECWWRTSSFYMLRVALDVGLMQTGDFRNISHFETKMSGCIECTTTVYSFGRRILETRERRTPLRSRGQAFLYQFDLVQQFFTSFFNGSQMLDNAEEARLSIENLSILQVFEGTDAGRPVLACIAFEFLCGTGDVEAARLVKFGDVAPAAE